MIQRKANFYRLYPTAEQERFFSRIAGACRAVYNVALDQRRLYWHRFKEKTGKPISFVSQAAELTALRAEFDWLKEVPSQVLQQALRDLDRAYQNFFSGRGGYPSLRRKGRQDTFRFPEPKTLAVERTGKKSGRIKLPKIGWVSFRGWYALKGDIRNVTITRKAGQWFASIQWQREVTEPQEGNLPAVGIDMGVAVFAALSDGTTIESQGFGRRAQQALKKWQRALARKKRGSNNRRKALRFVQKVHARVVNARKDFLHKISTTIAKNHSMVVMEDLKVKNMTASAKGTQEEHGRNVRQKAGLNRSILDQGWGLFKIFLGYKLAERGGKLVEVKAAYTSQTCSVCGCIEAKSRISQARFCCVQCGHEENADINAAKNILRRAGCALKPVEGNTQVPVEAGSTRKVA